MKASNIPILKLNSMTKQQKQQHWQKDMNMHGWNRKPGESSQMEPLIYIRVQVGEKSAFLTNGAGISICKRMRWDIYITPDIKSKWIKDLNTRPQIKKKKPL